MKTIKKTTPLMPAASPEKLALYAELLKRYFGTKSTMQRARLLAALEQFPVTSFEAQKYLGVYDPPARIFELRTLYNIDTLPVWQQTDADLIRKGIGLYVLRGKKEGAL